AAFQQLVSGDLEPVEHLENPIVTGQGQERVIDWHNTVVRDDQEQIVIAVSGPASPGATPDETAHDQCKNRIVRRRRLENTRHFQISLAQSPTRTKPHPLRSRTRRNTMEPL
ncbi:MAG: hypothetical protein LAQ30_25335, partial [Acidobacteriia bacterium]|nr:hypothetical protein [Terriglobia bacterium]